MPQTSNEETQREQQFLMLVQTGAIVREISSKTPVRTAIQVLGAAMLAFEYIPSDANILEAAHQFVDYEFSEEQAPPKTDWIIKAGL